MKATIETAFPPKCSARELEEFRNLVVEGDEVTDQGLETRIMRAHLLAWACCDQKMVAAAAIKNPFDSYRDRVFAKANVTGSASAWQRELGWIFVSTDYRRQQLATRLVNKLIDLNDGSKIFATARQENDPIAPLLQKFSFELAGDPYRSDDGQYDLVLYLRSI